MLRREPTSLLPAMVRRAELGVSYLFRRQINTPISTTITLQATSSSATPILVTASELAKAVSGVCEPIDQAPSRQRKRASLEPIASS